MSIQTTNPATGLPIATYLLFKEEEIESSIEKAFASFQHWKKKSFSERALAFCKLALLLRKKKKVLAELMANEMGKPITAGMGEVEKCAFACEHFAKKAKSYLKPRKVATERQKNEIHYLPLGVVLAIMPWNFPLWQVFRFAAPTLMAGNVGLLKHASNVTGTALAIMQLFLEAGFPEHVFQTLILDTKGAERVIAHEKIAAITLTGSKEAGSRVAALAGRHVKKVLLELGGSDPYIVCKDADLEKAAKEIALSRLNNNGQTCIAAKRIFMEKTIASLFLEKLKKEIALFKTGAPLSSKTHLGPLARLDLRDTLHTQVQLSIQKGAILQFGGTIPEGKGSYYPPTLLTNVRPGMPAFDEELFGPVFSLTEVENIDEAICLANQSRFGLAAAIFTKNLKEGKRIAIEELEAGSCFINGHVVSDPRLPFGGIKESGFGRELSQEGILEFVNAKTIALRGK